MKHMTKLSAVGSALAIAGVLAFSGQAMADTLGTISANISFPTATRTHTINTNIGSPSFAGQASGTESDAAWNFLPNPDGSFAAWCLEPTEFLADSQPNTYDVNTLEQAPQQGNGFEMGEIAGLSGIGSNTRADDLRLLVGGGYDFATGTFKDNVGGLTGRDLYTAFQVAVWEIANENNATSYDVTLNGFRRTGQGGSNWANVALQANHWLSNLGNYTPDNTLLALVDDNDQDFLVSQVPIPAAAWLFGSAMVGAVALGRRKKKAQAQA